MQKRFSFFCFFFFGIFLDTWKNEKKDKSKEKQWKNHTQHAASEMKEKFDMQNVKSRDKDEQAQLTHTHTVIIKRQREKERGREREIYQGCKQTVKVRENRLSSQNRSHLPLDANSEHIFHSSPPSHYPRFFYILFPLFTGNRSCLQNIIINMLRSNEF